MFLFLILWDGVWNLIIFLIEGALSVICFCASNIQFCRRHYQFFSFLLKFSACLRRESVRWTCVQSSRFVCKLVGLFAD